MTPQELIDMPGYGKAEKHLRMIGEWVISPKEKLEALIGKLETSLDDAQLAMSNIEDVWRELDT
jgi:hypothetical protein